MVSREYLLACTKAATNVLRALQHNARAIFITARDSFVILLPPPPTALVTAVKAAVIGLIGVRQIGGSNCETKNLLHKQLLVTLQRLLNDGLKADKDLLQANVAASMRGLRRDCDDNVAVYLSGLVE